MSGTLLGLEKLQEISQHTHILSEYVQTLCTESDSLFIKVQTELKDLENGLEDRISNLKRVCEIDKWIGYCKNENLTNTAESGLAGLKLNLLYV